MKDNVIGGADGPTSVFVVDKFNFGWINIFGLAIVILMLLPNIIYAVKFRNVVNKCNSKAMNIIEQIGRYLSMILMIFNIGIVEFGFASVGAFIICFIGNTSFLIIYWIIWGLYFKKKNMWKSMALAIIPTAIFLLCGITLRHYLLVTSAVVFGIGHIYVTYQNAK